MGYLLEVCPNWGQNNSLGSITIMLGWNEPLVKSARKEIGSTRPIAGTFVMVVDKILTRPYSKRTRDADLLGISLQLQT